ncbi:carboxylesterase family protein [Streptomyces sp. NPDC001833]|uniref:carboxylesterase family protein n=1 Tax=Streptomyces sp. NPDC001833 TaxID=3154658 RepID=UPI00333236CA
MTTPDCAGTLNPVDLDERRLVVRTKAGARRRRRENRPPLIRGIPFAAPPVGETRFQAPRPSGPWHGAREAHALAPSPPQ